MARQKDSNISTEEEVAFGARLKQLREETQIPGVCWERCWAILRPRFGDMNTGSPFLRLKSFFPMWTASTCHLTGCSDGLRTARARTTPPYQKVSRRRFQSTKKNSSPKSQNLEKNIITKIVLKFTEKNNG